MERLQRGRRSAVLTVRAGAVLEGTKTGDSIAVNGVCLTVTALSGHGFSADVMHETLDRYTVAAGPEVLRYVVEKGSVAIDGISLTVAAVTDRDFSVSVIPHTAAQTVLGERAPGDLVNLEADMIGKYVEKLLSPIPARGTAGGVTRDLLSRCGF